ncbi:hypothetical protein FWG86_00210 [Candidatus Saccharibacteria bacterium]|nr:hypothetical protein [Candidatus Saccharibacteria bacterium]
MKKGQKSQKKPRFLCAKWQAWRKERAKSRHIAQNPSPHKTFRKTSRHATRADKFDKPAEYFSIIRQTFRLVFSRKRLFFGIILVLMVASILATGFIGDERYNTITEIFDRENVAGLGRFGTALGTMLTTLTQGGLNPTPTIEQRLMTVFCGTLAFMATIYAMRQLLAKNKITLKDTLYNCFQPLVPCLLVLIITLIQLVPVLLIYITYSAAVQTEFLANPFYALIFFGFATLCALLSYHLALPSIIALVGVTAPGMYPLKAIANATDLIRGKRFNFILYILVGTIVVAVIWVATFIPIVMFDQWLKGVWAFWQGIPFAPLVWQFLTFFVIVLFSAYVYLYYRRLIDEFRPRPY